MPTIAEKELDEQTRQRSRRSPAIFIALLLSSVSGPIHAADTGWIVEPGPSVISDEERAIERDVDSGIVHGVILVSETQADDAYGATSELRHHVRAKVLSNEGRAIADVEILLRVDEKITSWWGKTLLPGGEVLELDDAQLVEQEMVRRGRESFRVMKGALPGVGPGAVIDYGFKVKGERFPALRDVVIQAEWPVRRFSYRWKTSGGFPSDVILHGPEGFDVTVDKSRTAVLLTARDLPPFREETMMPEVRLSAILYYMLEGSSAKGYWKKRAKDLERASRDLLAEDADRLVSGMEFSAEASLPDKLSAAYDWIVGNVENSLIRRSGERVELPTDFSGKMNQLEELFAQVARRLGARVDIVLGPDRTIGFWQPGFLDNWAFDLRFLAVREPGAPDEEVFFADPESGLGFGQLPYFANETLAFLADPASPRGIYVPGSVATENTSKTIGEVRYDGATRHEAWTRTSVGQSGFVEYHGIARYPEHVRREYIESLCGGGLDAEILTARHVLHHPPLSSELECELEVSLPGAYGERLGELETTWVGPWVGGIPDLPPGERIHPVWFPYPGVDIAEITIRAPEGLRPVEAPPPIRFSEEFGKYQLIITPTEDGYEIKRALALLQTVIPTESYDQLRQFLEKVVEADRTTVRFVRDRP
jgi:hypothetical protein